MLCPACPLRPPVPCFCAMKRKKECPCLMCLRLHYLTVLVPHCCCALLSLCLCAAITACVPRFCFFPLLPSCTTLNAPRCTLFFPVPEVRPAWALERFCIKLQACNAQHTRPGTEKGSAASTPTRQHTATAPRQRPPPALPAAAAAAAPPAAPGTPCAPPQSPPWSAG